MVDMKKTTVENTFIFPEGKNTVLYGIHIKSQNPQELPSDIQGIILETGIHQYLKDPLLSFQKMKEHVQYRELFEILEKKKIPVYFVDLKYRLADPILMMLDTTFTGIEWFAGMKLLKKGRKNPLNLLVGVWLVLPFLTNLLRLGSAFSGIGQQQSGALKKISHKLHPEADLLYLTIRNAVIAEKTKYLLRRSGDSPHLVTILGAGHVGIEDMLQMSEEKSDSFFRRYLPLIKKIAEHEYFYKIVEFRFNGKNWNVASVTEVPTLKNLLT
jgi:hypothetical protein